MRKIILFNMITLDGFFEGPNGDIDWHNVDDEFNDFSIEQLDTADCLLFGRKTFELMASYWPTEAALRDDPQVAEKMNSISKIVFSRTLQKADWNNTRLVKESTSAEITSLKQQPGKDMFLFGSADLAAALIQNGQIDEFRLMVNPVVLGSGKPMFKERLVLKLISARTFKNGNVLLCYE